MGGGILDIQRAPFLLRHFSGPHDLHCKAIPRYIPESWLARSLPWHTPGTAAASPPLPKNTPNPPPKKQVVDKFPFKVFSTISITWQFKTRQPDFRLLYRN